MPGDRLARFVLHKELKLVKWLKSSKGHSVAWCKKVSSEEACTRCGLISRSIYDHRVVTVKDAPIRGVRVSLKIKKRRFYCHSCRKPFTEYVDGIWPKRRTTQRFRRDVLWACENFQDLKRVRRAYGCSTALIYKIHYEQLALNVKHKVNYPWPKTIGIDEHFFRRGKYGRQFVTIITDYNNKRVREIVPTRIYGELIESLQAIPGRENVRNINMDLSKPYKTFAKEFFPHAKIIADKFHVLRL